MASPTNRSQRRKLILFISISLALHLALVGGFVLPDYIRRARDARLAVQAQEQAHQRAEERHRELALAAEEAKRAAAIHAAEQAKQQIAAALKDQFQAVVGEQIQGPDADQLWEDLLAQLTAGLNDYSHELAQGDASDADLLQGMTELQAKMLAELAARLRERSIKELSDSFVARVQTDVSPKLIEFYRKQLQTRIGNALRDEGQKIVHEDADDIRGKRQAVAAALAEAERQARSAAGDLTAAKKRLDEAAKDAEKLREGGNNDDTDRRIADAVRDEKPNVERAGKSLDAAAERLGVAAVKADRLAEKATQAIQVALDGAGAAVKVSAKARHDADEGKAEALSKSTADAAAGDEKLADAIKSARAAVAGDNGDVTIASKVALKRARNEDLKGLIEDAFWQNYANRSAPRLGKKLTGAFGKTLEEGGIKDDKAVAEVGKRVQAALIEKVKDKIKAGEVATDPLTHDQHLDDVADGPHGHGPHGPLGAGPGGGGDHHHDGDNAIAERIGKTARDLVHANIEGVGDDEAGDEAAVNTARGKAPRRAAAYGVEEEPGGIVGLAARVTRLAENVKGGRTDLADAALAGGAGASAQAGPGGAGLVLPHSRLFGPSHGPLLRNHFQLVDEAQYAKLTAGIHERDRLAARGQATTRRSADGEVAAPSPEIDARPTIQSAMVLMPSHSSAEPLGEAQKSEPFKPSFKSIRFAAIPYRSKPIVIDGDLSEWKDVPELPLTPANEKYAANPALKRFPQAVKVQWDNTGFYLAYDVKDADGKITKANPTDFWEGDGIEFWVDTLNTKEKHRTQCTHQFWAWVEGSAKDAGIVGGEARSWPGEDSYIGLRADVIKTASKRTDAGWSIEVFVPASRFRMLDLQPGRILGMNFSICTGTDLYYYWAGTTDIATARRPDTWGDVLLAGSAGRLECIDKSAVDLKAGETAKSIAALRIGEPLRVRVTDPDMNLNDSARDRISVIVSTRRGVQQTVILEETANATGVFEGALPTTLDTGEIRAGILPLVDGDKIDIVYTDQCRPDGSRDVPVKLTLPTASAVTSVPR